MALIRLKIVVILQVHQMVQCYIQMEQSISLWQHSTVTQGLRFRHSQHVHVKLTKRGVMRRQSAI